MEVHQRRAGRFATLPGVSSSGCVNEGRFFVGGRSGRERTHGNASAAASSDRMPEAGAALADLLRSNDQLL